MATLTIAAELTTPIAKSKRTPDPALTGVADEIEFTWLPGGPIDYGGTLKVATQDTPCNRCQCVMRVHWTVGALCSQCGHCPGWEAPKNA